MRVQEPLATCAHRCYSLLVAKCVLKVAPPARWMLDAARSAHLLSPSADLRKLSEELSAREASDGSGERPFRFHRVAAFWWTLTARSRPATTAAAAVAGPPQAVVAPAPVPVPVTPTPARSSKTLQALLDRVRAAAAATSSSSSISVLHNCSLCSSQFEALAAALLLLRAGGASAGSDLTAAIVRHTVADALRGRLCSALLEPRGLRADYADAVQSGAVWGNLLTLQAAVEIYQVRIRLHTCDGEHVLQPSTVATGQLWLAYCAPAAYWLALQSS